jgi:hypothetical protein
VLQNNTALRNNETQNLKETPAALAGFFWRNAAKGWIASNRTLTNRRQCSQILRIGNHLYYGDNLDILRSSITTRTGERSDASYYNRCRNADT